MRRAWSAGLHAHWLRVGIRATGRTNFAPAAASLRCNATQVSSATADAGKQAETETPGTAARDLQRAVRAGEVDATLSRLTSRDLAALAAAVDRCKSTKDESTVSFTRPSGAQWPKLFLRTALPFFAFGVCDNLIMLSVGDLIDEHFGVVMGFSTLIAAGLGQAVSDGSGVTIQCIIERHAEKLRFLDPRVDPAYLETKRANRLLQVFRTIGIVCGCLCGVLPALFMDRGNKPRLYDMLLSDVTDEDDRRALASNARYTNYPAGSKICAFGEEVEGIDTVVDGEVRVVARDAAGNRCVVVESEGIGFGIGFLEVVFEHPAVADVECVTDVRTLRIERQVVEERPELRGRFRQNLDKLIHSDPLYTPYLMVRGESRRSF